MEASLNLLIIGGGINGAGIARDAALRGLKVLLVEKGDLCGATTGASSGMIHGGARYLLFDRETTRVSCQDSGFIQKIAQHLIFRIPFLYPFVPGARESPSQVLAFLRAYDKFSALKGGKPHGRLSPAAARNIEPGLSDLVKGAATFDEWGIDTFRLVVANAQDAALHGAEIWTRAEVTGLIRDGARVAGARIRRGNETVERYARLVVNAAGPWAPRVAHMAGATVELRPAKGVHLVFDRRIVNQAIICTAKDRRAIFIQPHENETWLGTTDDDYYGDPSDPPILQDEVEYLLEAARRVFPSIDLHRMTRAFSGVRPTLAEWGPYEDDLSRRHEVIDHGDEDGVPGLVTLVGGKLAAYRLMAEEATDACAKLLGVEARSRTATLPLPGGDDIPDANDLAREYSIHPYAARRLVARHGSRARDVLAPTRTDPALRRVVCATEPVLEAEVRHVARHEWVETLADLERRTRFGLGACLGVPCVFHAARILAEEKGWDRDREEVEILRYLQFRWERRRPVLRGEALAAEAHARWRAFGASGLVPRLPADALELG